MFLVNVPKKRPRGRHKKRRQNTWHNFREWLWPSMGLMPLLRWMEINIKRNNAPVHSSALGAAIGVGITFTPFFGFHVILILILTRLFRANFWIGLVTSFVGNPWTFPFITLWTFWLGRLMLGQHAVLGHGAGSYAEIEDVLSQLWAHLFWPYVEMARSFLFGIPPDTAEHVELSVLWQQLARVWEHYVWPMTVGGIPSGMLLGVVVYFFARRNIEAYQHHRQELIKAARRRYAPTMLEKISDSATQLGEKITDTGLAATARMSELVHPTPPQKKGNRKK